MNFPVKISMYLQTIFATETRLAQGLTFTRFRTSEAETKLTVSEMDGKLTLFSNLLISNATWIEVQTHSV
jgi:hypothetical protein